MRLRTKFLDLEAGGKLIVTLSKEDAEELGVKSLGRIKIFYGKKSVTSIVNVMTKSVAHGTIGVYDEVKNYLDLEGSDIVEVKIAEAPVSLKLIINKLKGKKLTYEDTYKIVKDVVEGNLNETEIAAFVVSLNDHGVSLEEATDISMAMFETGKQLKFNHKNIFDKHSVGGVPGDKTTMVLVPIIAAAGLTIPKTSSRAITSAAGTADRVEVLMPVNLSVEEMEKVVKATNGCMVWGGDLYLSPADDIFVQSEFPLSIDPLLLPSIMSKKKAVGATDLVIDIPTGRGAKLKTIGEADLLAKDFMELGRRLGIRVQCVVTYGEQPIGYSIGPGLEAVEALEILMRKSNTADVIDKVLHVAGTLLEMSGKKNGRALALEILKSGKAEEKLREIIEHQGGDPKIKPSDIKIGGYGFDVVSNKSGIVHWIDNNLLVEIARLAGSPKDKGAGIRLYKKIGDDVKKGEKIFTVYSEKSTKLSQATKEIDAEAAYGIATRREMLIHLVKEIPVTKKTFILER